jgi:type IV secretion system protein VirB6
MSNCPALVSGENSGIATALRSIDCRTGETTAYAFGRLFGDHGTLLPALTILLTLYVAFFAISLLTGRSRIGVSALTPRMMTLGLVLTFATSWAAYQNVIWTITTGAPDQIASLLAGTHGSATTLFADRLDQLFNAIADAAQQAGVPVPVTGVSGEAPVAPVVVGGFSASTVLWLSALMLMLGTVGVLVTTKIALAVLLALGPLFIVLALFRGTHGLFEGWLKALVMLALTPLFAVLLGGTAIAALSPMVHDIAAGGGQPPARDVAVLFLGTCVYVALMVMALKAAGAIVAGWRLPGGEREQRAHNSGTAATSSPSRPIITPLRPVSGSPGAAQPIDDRVRRIVAGLPSGGDSPGSYGGGSDGRGRLASAKIVTISASNATSAPAVDHRLQGVGSRFRAPAAQIRKGQIS